MFWFGLFPCVCYKVTEAFMLSIEENWKKSHAESHKDWHMPARVSKPAWLGLFTALINGRLIWWHKWSWQQQKPQTVANPNSSHYHRCMRGAISPLLPDLSLGAFRVVSKKYETVSCICKQLALYEYPEANQLCWLVWAYVATLVAVAASRAGKIIVVVYKMRIWTGSI